jgi:hypothetical protein
MKCVVAGSGGLRACSLLPFVMVLCLGLVETGYAQGTGLERTFPQSKATVEQVLRGMQNATAGRLPVLDGFATSPDRPLERFQHGYYQSKFQVSSTASGGSLVRISVQVTAWYADPLAAHSGYQLLMSNGRLEGDLLDQLADQLASRGTQASIKSFPSAVPARTEKPPVQAEPTLAEPTPAQPTQSEATISAPAPRIPENSGGFSSSLAQTLTEQEKEKNGAEGGKNKLDDQGARGLQAEADSLEEILKSQAHPANLVAVKKSGTPVVASASLTAKTLFLASAHDEFEMLDFNRDWVHVRISGLSRGWIWRNNLEMPASVPDSDLPPSPLPSAGDLFHVTREEKAQFPGDWGPLRGKTVKIVSVEKTNESEKDVGPLLRLEFAKSVLDKDYSELAQKPQELAGIVLVFDSADGGMIAATLPTLQQWKAGALSDAALWHQCFFDPPESFTAGASSGGQ